MGIMWLQFLCLSFAWISNGIFSLLNTLFRNYTQENFPQQSAVNSSKSKLSSPMDDPFVVLESVSNSTPAYSSSDFLSELEQISKMSNSGGAKHGGSSNSSTKLKVPPKPAHVSKGEKGSHASTS